MVGADLGAPGPIALLQPQRFDRPVAGIGDAVRPPGCHQRIVHRDGELDRDMKLPAELSDVGDAQGHQRCAGDA
jgi:hypothetical protein